MGLILPTTDLIYLSIFVLRAIMTDHYINNSIR